MDGRKDFFKEFVRSLDQQAPYEDRKALALKALRLRYGQESSLLASEDRLLCGILQYRAGEFPWGTPKKYREKVRNMKKREHGNSPASMPPVLPSEPLVIDLIEVKEEEVPVGRRLRNTFESAKSLAHP